MECGICYDFYDDNSRRPRNLPCGHTFCTVCIASTMAQNRPECPSCRRPHKAKSVDQIPVSYNTEALLKEVSLKDDCMEAKEEVAETPRELSSRQVLLAAGLDKLSFTKTAREKLRSEVLVYEERIRSSIVQHEEFQETIQVLAEQNKTVLQSLKDELLRIEDAKQEDKRSLQILESLTDDLKAASTTADVAVVVDRVEEKHKESFEWTARCEEDFPDVSMLQHSLSMREILKKLQVAMTDEDGASTDITALRGTGMGIDEKLLRITAPKSLTISDLRGLSAPVRQLVETGQVVAIQEDRGRPRFARISLRDGYICLHHLQDHAPPDRTLRVSYGELVSALDPSSVLAFLELMWPSSPARRVFIRLSPDTPRARQFALLCTGERGTSYAGSFLSELRDRDNPGERLVGGNHDGGGGAAIVSRLTRDGKYRRPSALGLVSGYSCLDRRMEDQFGGLFSITTRPSPKKESRTAFGQVAAGMQVVQAAATLPDITKVVVADCGVVIPRLPCYNSHSMPFLL